MVHHRSDHRHAYVEFLGGLFHRQPGSLAACRKHGDLVLAPETPYAVFTPTVSRASLATDPVQYAGDVAIRPTFGQIGYQFNRVLVRGLLVVTALVFANMQQGVHAAGPMDLQV